MRSLALLLSLFLVACAGGGGGETADTSGEPSGPGPAPAPDPDPEPDPDPDPVPPPTDGIALAVEEPSGVARLAEPVSSGVPFAQGVLTSVDDLYVVDSNDTPVPAQFAVLSRWPDNSIRWLLVDLQATVAANATTYYALHTDGANGNPAPAQSVTYSTAGDVATVDTGAAKFQFDRAHFDLFSSVTIGGKSVVTSGHGSQLSTAGGATHTSAFATSSVTVKEQGPMKLVVEVTGAHEDASGVELGTYSVWLHFYAGSGLVRVLHRLENKNEAGHPGNFWDLGASGALWFDEHRLRLDLAVGDGASVVVGGASGTVSGTLQSGAQIYQDSSGGENWNSDNHWNGDEQVQTSFRGYRTHLNGTQVDSGYRPIGYLDISDGQVGVAVSIRNFWQNFPNKLAIDDNTLDVSLWPSEFAYDHEVQGGEYKTHEVMYYFHTDAAGANIDRARAFEDPLFARAPAAQFADSLALGYFVPANPAKNPEYETVVTRFVVPDDAGRSSVTQKEHIDEFGWRNFGDMMADHESHAGEIDWDVPISHYNNQYDGAFAALLHFVRNGNRALFDFGEAYARHTADIDIYHVDAADEPTYGGGHFWHTTHDVNALTSAHRTWSKNHKDVYPGQSWLDGGGPGLGHMYVRGLWTLYYLRGFYPARESALTVADFAQRRYSNSPGGDARSLGNTLYVLVDAYRETGESKYYDAMSTLVQVSSSNIGSSSTRGVFPAGLGGFLRLKVDMDEKGDSDWDDALDLLTDICDAELSSGSTKTHDTMLTEGFALAYHYAPASHANRDAYKTKAREMWDGIVEYSLWGDDQYMPAKNLCFFATFANVWPYFAD
ncbi:MAG: exo-rhamnogalacturonan lyase family protein [Planctomycetota bacterium]|jgi:hypothetical protein